MTLIFDIGNTNIKAALADRSEIIETLRFNSDLNTPSEVIQTQILRMISECGIKKEELTDSIISSVVPKLTDFAAQISEKIIQKKPCIINSSLYKKLPVTIPESAVNQIGTDLLCDAVGAWEKYRKPCIIINFGTALAFTAITQDAHICGVAITPGINTALKSLTANTAQLSEVPLEFPESSLGTTTEKSIQAGILFGYKGLVESLAERMKDDLFKEYQTPKDKIKVIATGGLSGILKPVTKEIDFYDPDLTLYGIQKCLEYIKE